MALIQPGTLLQALNKEEAVLCSKAKSNLMVLKRNYDAKEPTEFFERV